MKISDGALFKKSHLILFGLLVSIILFIWFLPKAQPSGSGRPLFEYDISEISSIEYKSETQNYIIKPHPMTESDNDKPLWKIKSFSKDGQKTGFDFWGNSTISGIVKNMAGLNYLYKIKNNTEKHKEYGLEDCPFYIQLKIQEVEKDEIQPLCLGKGNYNNAKKYIWPKDGDEIYIAASYLFNRYETDIFKKINKKLVLSNLKRFDSFSIQLSKKIMRKYPILANKIQNTLYFVKNPTPKRLSWLIKGQPDEISKAASGFHPALSNLNLNFVAVDIKPDSLKDPSLKVTFYNQSNSGNENSDAKSSETYQLWNTPYPKDMKFIPHQNSDKNRKLHAVASSSYHWGVYHLKSFNRIQSMLNQLELAFKKLEEKKLVEEEKLKKLKVNKKQKNKKAKGTPGKKSAEKKNK